MSRCLSLASALVLLLVAGCGDGPDSGGWSAVTRDAYTEGCVSVANAHGGIADPDGHCACTLRRLQAEFDEAEYLARSPGERDAVSSLYGEICAIRNEPPAGPGPWPEPLQAEYTAECVPAAGAAGTPDPGRLCACTLEGLQEVYSKAGYLAVTDQERETMSGLVARICELRLARG